MTTPSDKSAPPAEEKKEPLTIAIRDGKIFYEVEHELYIGWQELPDVVLADTNKIRNYWTGGKLGWELWEEIVAFMRWSQKTHKAEALLTLFYNRMTKEWKGWPFPQSPVGMTISYDTQHPLYAPDRAQFGKDWIQLGSVHHHCAANAFQSGTDKHDEDDRDGLHVTLGNMNDDKLDTHSRQVFDGLTNECNLVNWIKMPDWCAAIPHFTLRHETFARAIALAGLTATVPAEWKLRVIEKKTEPYQYSQNRGTAHRTNGSVAADAIGHESRTAATWWTNRKKAVEMVCNRLSLSPTRAYSLISGNVAEMDDEAIMLRRELTDACFDQLCPVHYAHSILEELSNEEMAEEQSRIMNEFVT